MSFRSVISDCIFCLLFSYSISTGLFPRNFTSFLFTSWYRCLTFSISDSFIVLLSAGIIDIGEPVSMMNSFSVPLIFTVVVKYLFLSIILFTLSILCMLDSDSSLSSPIRFSVSVTFRDLFFFQFSFRLHVRAKWPFFPQLLHVWSSAGHLCIGFQFGALQNLQGLLLLTFFLGRELKLSILCIGSSLISSSQLDISASGIVFSSFFFSYVFCLINSIVFFISGFFLSSVYPGVSCP